MLKWSFYNIFSGKLTVNKKSVRLSRQMSRVPSPEKFAQGELLTRADCHPCRLNKNIYVWIKKHTTIFAFTLHLSYLYSIKNIYSIVNKCTKNLKCICTHSLTSHKYCKDDILPWSLSGCLNLWLNPNRCDLTSGTGGAAGWRRRRSVAAMVPYFLESCFGMFFFVKYSKVTTSFWYFFMSQTYFLSQMFF